MPGKQEKFLLVQVAQTIEFTTSGYGSSDVAYLRDVYYHAYGPIPTIAMIEQTKMPKSLNGLKNYNVMHGYPRYQSTGNKGCEVEFTALFNDISHWREFMGGNISPSYYYR